MGKITSGDSDELDVYKDWCKIDGVKEGLHQYYELEQTTDLCSLNTGRVMAKIGVNNKNTIPQKSPCTFVIIDNKPHLNESGIRFLCNWIDGKSISKVEELNMLKALKLIECNVLENSYVQLRYRVINE